MRTEILLASLASVWLFLPSCMLTWGSSFAIAAIIVTQLTTPHIRIAPAAGDDQLTGQTFKYRRVILPISCSFFSALSPLCISSFALRLVDSVSDSGGRLVPALMPWCAHCSVCTCDPASSTAPPHDLIVCLSVCLSVCSSPA